MHGRHETVKYCFNKMPFIDKVVIYSKPNDGKFLEQTNYFAKAQYPNNPLSYKWGAAVMSLEQLDFDGVILLGSDDYIDPNFYEFAKKNIHKYDMIGFTDAYYECDGTTYYWEGYDNHRTGEPVGAGKIYNRKFLERINFDLYPKAKEVGLDYMAQQVCIKNEAKMLITSLKKEGLFMCDVKDGEGMNSLEKLQRYYKIKKV